MWQIGVYRTSKRHNLFSFLNNGTRPRVSHNVKRHLTAHVKTYIVVRPLSALQVPCPSAIQPYGQRHPVELACF